MEGEGGVLSLRGDCVQSMWHPHVLYLKHILCILHSAHLHANDGTASNCPSRVCPNSLAIPGRRVRDEDGRSREQAVDDSMVAKMQVALDCQACGGCG